MKLSVSREKLLPAASAVASIVEKRQTLPILGNILVQASSDKMTLTSTDLEIEITTSFSFENRENVEFTVTARKFLDICRNLPEGAIIQLEVLGDKVKIVSNRSRFSLGILSAADFPAVESDNILSSTKIKEGDLKKLIEKTQFSMAHQDVRYYLNGMLLEITNETMKSVATDGHRLALCEVGFDGYDEDKKEILVPRKAVLELNRLLKYSDTDVTLEISSNFIRIIMDDTCFSSKLIDGKYPDYERVIPKDLTKEALVDKEALKNALIRTAILSSEKYKGVRMCFEKNTLKIQAHNPEQEEAEEEISIVYDFDPITIGFNVNYLLEIINTFDSDDVVLKLENNNSSTIVTESGGKGSLYVVMPMRL